MNDDSTKTIDIDGSRGEGGGQVLRTSLALSLITGRGFRIEHIRAKRGRPGLLRQHLTAVKAAAAISGAEVEGATAGSGTLAFHPGPVRGGDYCFAIGTAGSCTLVLQTVLLPLLVAGVSARIRLTGGTHNPLAPPADFLQQAYLPLLRRMGAAVELRLERHGFFPAGGGELALEIGASPRLQPLVLEQRGKLCEVGAEVLIAGLPIHIAERELEVLHRSLGWERDRLRPRGLPNAHGPGNVLVATVRHERVTEVFTAFGAKGVRAEQVAKGLCAEVTDYLRGGAPVGPHLADQLLLPLSVAGGVYLTRAPTGHTLTNLETIGHFLPDRLSLRGCGDGTTRVESVPPGAGSPGDEDQSATS